MLKFILSLFFVLSLGLACGDKIKNPTTDDKKATQLNVSNPNSVDSPQAQVEVSEAVFGPMDFAGSAIHIQNTSTQTSTSTDTSF